MRITRIVIAAWATIAIAACGVGEVAEVETALEQSFGGLEESDEPPMFGDEAIFEELDEADGDTTPVDVDDESDTNADDIIDESIEDGDVGPNDRPQRALVVGIKAIWGRREIDATDTTVTEWNPTFTTDCGVLGLRKLIRFDRNDSVVRPRESAQSISFISQTAPAYDGVVIALAIPSSERECAARGYLTITSDALEEPIQVPLGRDIANAQLRVQAGENRTFVLMAQAHEPPRDTPCVKGTFSGRWVRGVNDAGEPVRKGRFYGRVFDVMGNLKGHMRGVWGNPNHGRFAGQQVMFGKLINQEGRFVGLLAGRYGDDGRFGGGWHLRPSYRNVHGHFGGFYRAAADETVDGGVFRGRYASAGCDEPVDEVPLADED